MNGYKNNFCLYEPNASMSGKSYSGIEWNLELSPEVNIQFNIIWKNPENSITIKLNSIQTHNNQTEFSVYVSIIE